MYLIINPERECEIVYSSTNLNKIKDYIMENYFIWPEDMEKFNEFSYEELYDFMREYNVYIKEFNLTESENTLSFEQMGEDNTQRVAEAIKYRRDKTEKKKVCENLARNLVNKNKKFKLNKPRIPYKYSDKVSLLDLDYGLVRVMMRYLNDDILVKTFYYEGDQYRLFENEGYYELFTDKDNRKYKRLRLKHKKNGPIVQFEFSTIPIQGCYKFFDLFLIDRNYP